MSLRAYIKSIHFSFLHKKLHTLIKYTHIYNLKVGRKRIQLWNDFVESIKRCQLSFKILDTCYKIDEKVFYVTILLTCEFSVMWVSMLLESGFMILKIKKNKK